MPFAAQLDRRVEPWDCILLTALSAAPQDTQGWTRVGVQTLADTLRVSKPWVIKAMRRLEGAGWIEARRKTDPTTNADLPTERRVNWSNPVPGLDGDTEASTITPGVNEDYPVEAEGDPLPDGFPTQAMVAAAAGSAPHLPIRRVVDDFRAYHTEHASLRKSWPKAWQVWVRKAEKDYPHERQGSGAVPGSLDARRRAGASRLAEAAAGYALRRPH
ncbi:hypothetical protein [Azospirillum sp. sgz301742]